MDPKHLHYLGEVVRYGSISRAAEQLGIAQSTVTRVVKILEDRVGAPIVQRGRYGVSPTEIGDMLAAHGRKISAETAAAATEVERWRAGLGGELRVGVGPMLALSVMPRFLAGRVSKGRRYPILVVTAAAAPLVDQLNEGTLDVALAPEELNLHQEKLFQQVVFKDEMAIFTGPMSPLVNRTRPVDKAQLENCTWIRVGVQSGIHGSAREVFDRLGLEAGAMRLRFSGDVSIALELLRTTDVTVALPRRLTLLCGGISENQLVPVATQLPDRNVALWVTKSNRYRPEILDFRDRVLRMFRSIG